MFGIVSHWIINYSTSAINTFMKSVIYLSLTNLIWKLQNTVLNSLDQLLVVNDDCNVFSLWSIIYGDLHWCVENNTLSSRKTGSILIRLNLEWFIDGTMVMCPIYIFFLLLQLDVCLHVSRLVLTPFGIFCLLS